MARTRLIGLPYAGEGKELKAAVGPWGRGAVGPWGRGAVGPWGRGAVGPRGRIPRIPFSCPLLTRRRRRSRGWWII